MKTFEQFLAEARMAPLYHFTKAESAISIIKSGGIKSTVRHPHWKAGGKKTASGLVHGISTTRSIRYAAHGMVDDDMSFKAGVVFVIDQQKVLSRYRITPFQFWDDRELHGARANAQKADNEYEEFIHIKEPLKLDYVTAVIVNREEVEDSDIAFIEASRKHWKLIVVDTWRDVIKVGRTIQ